MNSLTVADVREPEFWLYMALVGSAFVGNEREVQG